MGAGLLTASPEAENSSFFVSPESPQPSVGAPVAAPLPSPSEADAEPSFAGVEAKVSGFGASPTAGVEGV